MERTVKREIIDEWIHREYPDGMTKLASASGVPASTISKIRSGRVPKRAYRRDQLAKALGVSETELFPVLPDGEGVAS